MTLLRSLAFSLLFWTWSAGMHVLALPLLAAPRTWLLAVGRIWLGGLLWLTRVVAGIGYEVRGWENLPAGPCIVASKHQSAWDTFALPVLLNHPSFVLKKELMQIPLFGWYLRRYGAIPVDRSAGAKALRGMLRTAEAEVARGRAIVIFPEGTRVPPGESRPYHPGVAALYRDLDLPLVPVTLNSGLFWGRRAFLKRPGRIVLTFHPPIAPGLPRREVMARLAEALNTPVAGGDDTA
jgi:1-acyl-sn-glycerol-3-phosphate acyltransferase